MIRNAAILLSMSLFLLIACEQKEQSSTLKEDIPSEQKISENILYYTCPMDDHKHIHSDKPGDCPECGMHMVAVVETTPDSAEYYGCSMPEHSHVRSEKPGNCPECGMNLVPMRKKNEAKM